MANQSVSPAASMAPVVVWPASRRPPVAVLAAKSSAGGGVEGPGNWGAKNDTPSERQKPRDCAASRSAAAVVYR